MIIALLAVMLWSVSPAQAQMANTDQQNQSALTASPSLILNPPPPVGQFSVLAGLSLNTHVEKLGFNVGGKYQITDMIAGMVMFTYFFLSDVPGGSQSAWSLDFNGLYPVYEVEGGMIVYAMAGLNYLNWSWSSDYCDGGSIFGISCDWSVSDIGLNAGGMLVYPLGGFNVFATAAIVGLGGGSSGLNIGAGGSVDL
jgi:hypothetical protein